MSQNFVCQNCFYCDSNGQITYRSNDLHLSHFIGRGNYQVRWDTRNGFCLCAKCHHYYENRPSEHTFFATSILGQSVIERLEFDSNQALKWSKGEKEEMYLHYKSEYNRVKTMRQEGMIMPITIENFKRWTI